MQIRDWWCSRAGPEKKRRKQPVNLSIDADLLAAAKACGTNMSGVLEGSLAEVVRAHRSRLWRAEHRDAIQKSNQDIEANGLWCDPYRPW